MAKKEETISIPIKETIDEILSLIGTEPSAYITALDGNTYKVGTKSLRLLTFKNTGVVCPFCGITATHFTISYQAKSLNYHLNLFSNDILFTHDHIVARSKGGKDDLSNTRTMCGPCNWGRGDGKNDNNLKRVTVCFNPRSKKWLVKVNKSKRVRDYVEAFDNVDDAIKRSYEITPNPKISEFSKELYDKLVDQPS